MKRRDPHRSGVCSLRYIRLGDVSRLMEDKVREYYDALDEKRYDDLEEVLASDVVHHRPGGTLDGRQELIEFASDGRPTEDTTHKIDGFFTEGPKVADGSEVAAVGRFVRDTDEEVVFDFLDVFEGGKKIDVIRTYTP